jgi:hypothetical protein
VTALSIVIVSFNARTDLQACLLALKKAPPSLGPRDPRRGQCVGRRQRRGRGADSRRPRHPDGAQRGFSAANNAGIRESRGGLLLLLNSDTLSPPGAIDNLVARLLATTPPRWRARAWWTRRANRSSRSAA